MSVFKNWTDAEVAWHNQQVAAGKSGAAPIPAGEGVDKESDLHDQIYDWCRAKGFIALHSSMAERTTRNKGEWDYTIIGSIEEIPKVWFVECKSKDGKLTMEQHAMITHAESHGHKVHVVRSMEEFIKVII